MQVSLNQSDMKQSEFIAALVVVLQQKVKTNIFIWLKKFTVAVDWDDSPPPQMPEYSCELNSMLK